MLEVIKIQDSSPKWRLFDESDPFAVTWVVSDLRSKLELQSRFLENRPGIPADCVLRANELWRRFFTRKAPQFHLLPEDWSMIAADRFLTSEEFDKHPALRATTVRLMNTLAPLLFHPERGSVLADFLQEHGRFAERYGRLMEPMIGLFDWILEKQWMIESWVPAALESGGLLEDAPISGRYVFDLGGSLTSVEAQLIERLSKRVDVAVFLPSPEFAEDFSFLLAPGEELFSKADSRQVLSAEPAEKERSFWKFSGRLAEVKQAVAQVRRWLDEGVSLENIAIITPFFEQDFTVLEKYFALEGVPLRRRRGVRLQTLGSVQSALARLRLASSDLRYSDVQLSFRDQVPERFEKFSASMREALEPMDLARSTAIQQRAELWRWENREVDFTEFHALLNRVWPHEGPAALQVISESLFAATPEGWKQPVSQWIHWLENRVAKLEMGLPDRTEGLNIVSLKSADLPQWTHRIFLSMVEKLPSAASSLLFADEVSSLGWKYGFFLPHPEQELLQFELQWLADQRSSCDRFSYPMTDWSGALQSPQAFWLRGADQELPSAPWPCRWDEIQLSKLFDSENLIARRLARDAGLHPVKPLPPREFRFSISALERFLRCPFVFAAERQFGLMDEALKDLDIDRRGLGNFYHKLAEKLTVEPVDWHPSEEQLSTLVTEAMNEVGSLHVEREMEAVFLRRACGWARRFLAAEKEMADNFPRQKVLARELRFDFYHQDGQWSREPLPEGKHFAGQIDRVSGIEGGPLVLFDYKTSVQPHHALSAWLRENNLQMAFYSWAVNEGLVMDSKGQVAGALYYDFKTMSRKQGFALPEGEGLLFEAVLPKKIDREKIEEIWEETVNKILATAEQVSAGEMTPRPSQMKHCERCQWSGLCRAPHLNL